jgi:hypothetical protein
MTVFAGRRRISLWGFDAKHQRGEETMKTNALHRFLSAAVLVLAAALVLTLSGVGNQTAIAAPPTSGGSAPVTVVNDTANPVPIQAAEDLFQFNVSCSENGAENTCYADLSDELVIPTDKRFVIKYVTASITSDNDENDPREFFWWLNVNGQGQATAFTTTATKRVSEGSEHQWFIGDANVLIYVDEILGGGALPQFTCVANRNNVTNDYESFLCNFFVSGYFTPKP